MLTLTLVQDFIKEADGEAFRGTLTTMEDWLYEEGEEQPKKVRLRDCRVWRPGMHTLKGM